MPALAPQARRLLATIQGRAYVVFSRFALVACEGARAPGEQMLSSLHQGLLKERCPGRCRKPGYNPYATSSARINRTTGPHPATAVRHADGRLSLVYAGQLLNSGHCSSVLE